MDLLPQWEERPLYGGKGFVRLVDVMGDDTAVVQAARVSTGSGSKGIKSDSELIRYLYKHRHVSPFEMVEFKFHIRIPIFVERQVDRHRTFSTNRESGRYKELVTETVVPHPLNIQHATNRQALGGVLPEQEAALQWGDLRSAAEWANNRYHAALRMGVAREQARAVLPLGQMSESYWKGDLRNIFHFLGLRLSWEAQRETREFAEAVAAVVREVVPVCYDAFERYELNADLLDSEEKEFLKAVLAHYTGDLREQDLLPVARRLIKRWYKKEEDNG